MSTQRSSPRPSKSRDVASQPAAQQSSPQSMSGRKRQTDESDRQRNALDNQGSQGRHHKLSLREEEDDDSATRH